MSKYLLGINVGSQSVRVFLYDENMQCVFRAAEQQDVIATPKPALATQRASYWWKAVSSGIRKITQQFDAKDIVAVGTCAHMHGAVPVSADGTVLDDDIQMYSDKRGYYIAERLKQRTDSDELFHLAANPPTTSWFGIKIKWIQENNPDVYNQTKKFLTPKDYINFKLTGACCIDPSEASGAFLMDCKTDTWSERLIEAVGVDGDKLPDICQSASVVGSVTASAMAETGLAEGTKVVCGGGDMLSTLFVSGLSDYGNLVDSTATASAICYYSPKPIMDPNIMNLRNVIEGWVPFGHVDASGGAYRWLRDTLAKQEKLDVSSRDEDAYEYLNSLAGDAQVSADGLIFLPYMMGERTMGSAYSRGCYIGINPGTKIGHMVRALLEGVAFQHLKYINVMCAAGAEIKNVYCVSGGAKGDLWNQIKADIYDQTVYALDVDDGESFGAALLAAVGAGIYPDAAAAARSLIKVRKEYTPIAENVKKYKKIFGIFSNLHSVMQKPFYNLAKTTGQVQRRQEK